MPKDPSPAKLEKKLLRQKMRMMLRECSTEEKAEWSQKICQKVAKNPQVKAAGVIAAYYPIHNEVNISPLLQKFAAEEKVILLPRISKKNSANGTLEFCPIDFLKTDTDQIDQNFLEIGPFNILQPTDQTPVFDQHLIDVFLIPGLAFDEQGYRLGYGKGFYDKFLQQLQHPSLKIGLCFDKQLLPNLPREPQDQKLDKIITENRTHF